jgi:hypothetical protein
MKDYAIRFAVSDKGAPSGKVADAEIHFTGGIFAGLKLAGFGVWERRAGGLNVTVPARQYSVNGERRSYALLRPILDASAQDTLRETIIDAWREYERTAADETPIAAPILAPIASTYAPVHYDTPAEAAAAARAGAPILISDLIPKRTPTPQIAALPGMSPAGFRQAPTAPTTPAKTPGQAILF